MFFDLYKCEILDVENKKHSFTLVINSSLDIQSKFEDIEKAVHGFSMVFQDFKTKLDIVFPKLNQESIAENDINSFIDQHNLFNYVVYVSEDNVKSFQNDNFLED